MLFLSRLIAALAYAGAAFLFGLTLGERGELGVVQVLFAAVIPLTTVILMILAKQGRAYVVATGLAMLAGLLLGQHQYERAWRECVTAGPSVRAALVAHHSEYDGYPNRLEELGITLPCRAGLRKSILHYLSNDRGFRLWITNDRQTIHFTASGKSSARPRN